MKAKPIFLLLLLPLLAQCASPRSVAAPQDTEQLRLDKEQVWQLVAVQGREVPSSAHEIILMFHPESGTLRGRVACNRYFADYTLHHDATDASGSRYRLEVKYVSGGDVQCPEGGMSEQERYLTLLERADACLLTSTTLTLSRKGKETLKFGLQ